MYRFVQGRHEGENAGVHGATKVQGAPGRGRETPEPGRRDQRGRPWEAILLDRRQKAGHDARHRRGGHHGAGDGLSTEEGGSDAARLGVRADAFLG